MENIETWVDSKIRRYSEDSYNLFKEAIMCYKIKAFRASLLFSYLGFFKYIKELLNKSKKPSTFDQSRWDSILQNIVIEEKWEEEILKALNNSTNPVFNIKDNIRIQIKYWKDRRNDCAHAKDNIISHQHVESFWIFLQSNLSKITLEGGKLNLLNKFLDQFDTTKTSKFDSYDFLIDEIENTVDISEINDFIEQLEQNIFDKTLDYQKLYEVYDKIFTRYNSVKYIKKSLIQHLKNKNRDLDCISYYPSNFLYFEYDSSEVRQIWKSKMYLPNNSYNRDKILGFILLNNQFNSNDLKELTELYIDKFDQSGFKNLTKDIHTRNLLGNSHFLNKVYMDYFDKDKLKDIDFKIINMKADLIALYVEKCDLTNEILNTLGETYKKMTPNFLSDSLREVLTRHPEIKLKIKKICESNSIDNLSIFYN